MVLRPSWSPDEPATLWRRQDGSQETEGEAEGDREWLTQLCRGQRKLIIPPLVTQQLTHHGKQDVETACQTLNYALINLIEVTTVHNA